MSARYFGWGALVLDVAFANLGIVLIALIVETTLRDRATQRMRMAIAASIFLLVLMHLLADSVSVHL